MLGECLDKKLIHQIFEYINTIPVAYSTLICSTRLSYHVPVGMFISFLWREYELMQLASFICSNCAPGFCKLSFSAKCANIFYKLGKVRKLLQLRTGGEGAAQFDCNLHKLKAYYHSINAKRQVCYQQGVSRSAPPIRTDFSQVKVFTRFAEK